MLEEAACTCSNADHHSQALISFPHDDGSQDLAAQQAVLDASSEAVEALVAQHGHLIVQGAATHRELGWGHNSTGCEQVTGQLQNELTSPSRRQNAKNFELWVVLCPGAGEVLFDISGKTSSKALSSVSATSETAASNTG